MFPIQFPSIVNIQLPMTCTENFNNKLVFVEHKFEITGGFFGHFSRFDLNNLTWFRVFVVDSFAC